MEGSPDRYYMELDEQQTIAKLWNLKNPSHTAKLSLQFPKPQEMKMAGQVDGHPVVITMERVDISDPEKFPLMNKGLHWVNPAIDNR